MSLIKNKKAVEGLPLKYIIIALVAALVVGIALQFTGVLKGGIMSTAEKINESTTEKTTCALDSENPIITNIDGESGTISADIADDCGIDAATAYLNQDSTTKDTVTLALTSGTKTSGTWSGTSTLTTGVYNITVWAQDKASTTNEVSETENNINIS